MLAHLALLAPRMVTRGDGLFHERFAFQLRRQPARHDFDDVRLWIAEIAHPIAVDPERSQRHRGTRDRHANRRAKALLGHFPIVEQRRFVHHHRMAEQRFEIGECWPQWAGRVEQPSARQTQARAQLKLGRGWVEQIKCGGLTANRFGAAFEHGFQSVRPAGARGSSVRRTKGTPVARSASRCHRRPSLWRAARPTNRQSTSPAATLVRAESPPMSRLHSVKSLMCPGEIPTPGLTGADHIRFVGASVDAPSSEIQLPASGLDKRLACPVEHGLVFVRGPCGCKLVSVTSRR